MYILTVLLSLHSIIEGVALGGTRNKKKYQITQTNKKIQKQYILIIRKKKKRIWICFEYKINYYYCFLGLLFCCFFSCERRVWRATRTGCNCGAQNFRRFCTRLIDSTFRFCFVFVFCFFNFDFNRFSIVFDCLNIYNQRFQNYKVTRWHNLRQLYSSRCAVFADVTSRHRRRRELRRSRWSVERSAVERRAGVRVGLVHLCSARRDIVARIWQSTGQVGKVQRIDGGHCAHASNLRAERLIDWLINSIAWCFRAVRIRSIGQFCFLFFGRKNQKMNWFFVHVLFQPFSILDLFLNIISWA